MKHNKKYIDPDLPEGLGDALAALPKGNEWKVPDQYFEMLEHRIMAQVDCEAEDVPSEFFTKQQQQIFWKRSHSDNEWEVPATYFDQLPERIMKRRKSTKIVQLRTTQWRLAAVLAVAASLVWMVLYFRPQPSEGQSFADLIEQENLELDDLEYIIEGDELFAFSIDEEIAMVNDTIAPDSTKIKNTGVKSNTKQDAKPAQKPTLNQKKNTGKDDSKNKPKVNWDELQNDDILYYLNSEGYPDDDI